MAGYIGAWLIAVLLFGGIGSWIISADGRLHNLSAPHTLGKLARHVRFDAQNRPYMETLPTYLQWLVNAAPQDVGFRLFDAQGQTLLWSSPATQGAWANSPLLQQTQTARTVHLGEVTVHTAARPLTTPTGQTIWLQIALSERLTALRYDELGSTVKLSIALAAAVSVLLLGLVLWRVVQYALAPIQRVSREAQAIEPRGPWRRLGMQGLPSEIEPLVHSFNQALNRLEDEFERQQRFLADAAHELKTPLALLRAHIELGENDSRILLEDIDHMSRQVQQLLMLAEVSEPRSYKRAPLDIDTDVGEVLRFIAPLAAKRGITLQSHRLGADDPATTLYGDRSALFVLLKNLVENAIYISPPGSSVTISVLKHAIQVRDEGPGIAAEYLPRIFDRFWRVPGSPSGGAGLGLSICQEVAIAHGWQLHVRNTQPGAEFTLVLLPAATGCAAS